MEQQQQWSQMVNESAPLLIPTISTEQIQKCLEENTQLILFILESKRLGRHKDCEMHTTKLQHNLTFLSNLADVMAQPSPPPPPPLPKPMPPQVMAVGPTRQQGHWSAAPRQIQLSDEQNRIQQQQQGYYLQQQQQFMGFGGIENNNNNNNNSYVFDHQDGGGAPDSTVATNFLGI